MSCRVIVLNASGCPGSDAGRIKELSSFTHYCVNKKAVAKVKKMLAQLAKYRVVAHDADDSHSIADIDCEIAGILYTLQALGISLK